MTSDCRHLRLTNYDPRPDFFVSMCRIIAGRSMPSLSNLVSNIFQFGGRFAPTLQRGAGLMNLPCKTTPILSQPGPVATIGDLEICGILWNDN